MEDDIQQFPLIEEAQCRAKAQARHLYFSICCLESKIKAIGTFWISLIHHPNGKTEGEGKEGYVLQTQPSKAKLLLSSFRGKEIQASLEARQDLK